jgi:hypothetical protein
MLEALYNGYMSFALTLFCVVGSFSVCCIACIILFKLAIVALNCFKRLKGEWNSYEYYKKHAGLFGLWIRQHPDLDKEVSSDDAKRS